MSVVEAGRGGAVYDRGYRPYDGPRGQRGAATFALYKATMRRALGIRRSWRQKVAPFTLLGIVTIPAIVNVGIGYVTRDRFLSERIHIITYREYVGVSAALLRNRRLLKLRRGFFVALKLEHHSADVPVILMRKKVAQTFF